ncbi:MAG: fluoride efflux transporter CrcB [Spirochaeta sp.]|jgi:CrcB protein|nr:fluoride efflux transporter CrcB [Spirochaeta sp.]
MWQKLLGLGLAGAAGTLARYGLAGLAQKASSFQIPLGTLTVNVLGCFLFGIIWVTSVEKIAIPTELRTIILTGFLGSFTTFSSFLFETDQLIEQSQWLMAGTNVVIEVAGGLAAYMLGAFIGALI